MRQTILIVDDDLVLCRVLGRVLAAQGYEVVQAADATEARAAVQAQPPRLALIDLCLPDQDGTTLAQELRAYDADLPLVLMTAYPLQRADRAELASLFSAVLIKPLDLRQLRGAIQAALLRRTAAEDRPSLRKTALPLR